MVDVIGIVCVLLFVISFALIMLSESSKKKVKTKKRGENMVKEKYGLKGLKKFAVLAPLSFMMFVGCDRLTSFSNKKHVGNKEIQAQAKALKNKESAIDNELKGIRLNKSILTTREMITKGNSELKKINRIQKRVDSAIAKMKSGRAEKGFVRSVAESKK
jgi:hypothetical protein